MLNCWRLTACKTLKPALPLDANTLVLSALAFHLARSEARRARCPCQKTSVSKASLALLVAFKTHRVISTAHNQISGVRKATVTFECDLNIYVKLAKISSNSETISRKSDEISQVKETVMNCKTVLFKVAELEKEEKVPPQKLCEAPHSRYLPCTV